MGKCMEVHGAQELSMGSAQEVYGECMRCMGCMVGQTCTHTGSSIDASMKQEVCTRHGSYGSTWGYDLMGHIVAHGARARDTNTG